MSSCSQPQAHPTRCGCGFSAETDWRNALRTANEHTKQLIAEGDALRTANQRLRGGGARLKTALSQAVEYLDVSNFEQINSRSVLHTRMQAALSTANGEVTE